MGARTKRALPALIGLGLFIIAVEILRRELRAVSWVTLTSGILHTPPGQLAIALLLTVINYAVLTGYDFVALAYVGRCSIVDSASAIAKLADMSGHQAQVRYTESGGTRAVASIHVENAPKTAKKS